ncbi:DeoR/GlpR transcriptional regulator [Candidatus Aerophobetes bacterium]|nr:DeoR/GlpR transcriptional regulator [Candidatus Aerophobetes bacterium]
MFGPQRHNEIIQLITERGIIRISELSTRLRVSENTIRRDLRSLEKLDILQRVHGGAILKDFYKFKSKDLPFISREGKYVEEKDRIGRRAADLIRSEEIIFLDAGTTVAYVPKHIKHRSRLTVITNALNIAMEMNGQGKIVVILTGGIFRKEINCLIGFPAEDFIGGLEIDKAFIGASGVSVDKGVTNLVPLDTGVKKAAIKAAKEVILLVTHDKLNKTSLDYVAPITAVHKIITDKNAPPQKIRDFEAQGIEVILA